MADIKVSILCATYNHEKFIRDALDGFIKQKTNFRFEILIHDDASTDNTAQIIKEYEKKYPQLIKPIYQKENQYSKGQGIVGKIQRGRAQGEYIALCEGDDYWIDENKLQKQYDWLETHPEVNICAAASLIVDSKKRIIGVESPSSRSRVLSVEEVIKGGGGFVATNTLFYRKSIMDNPPDFIKHLNYDYSLQIYGSLPKGMMFFTEKMGVYRKFSSPTSWTSQMKNNVEKHITFHNKVIKMLEELNDYTHGQYQKSIRESIWREEYWAFSEQHDYKGMIKSPYYKCIGLKHRIRPLMYYIIGKK